MNKKSIATVHALLVVFCIYLGFASVLFAFRHPWMTQTERFIYMGRALRFGTVEYDEARPRRSEAGR